MFSPPASSTFFISPSRIDCAAGDDDYRDGVMKEEAYLRYAEQWVALGARLIGGCCSIGPSHIARLAEGFGLSKEL